MANKEDYDNLVGVFEKKTYTVKKYFINNYHKKFNVFSSYSKEKLGTLFTSSTEFQTAVVVLDFCKAQMNVLLDTSKPDDLPNSFQNHIKVFNLLFVESFEIKNNGFSFEYEKRYYGFKNIGTENSNVNVEK